VLLSSNITVFAFDFAGCGNSEGKYITLGVNESEDTEAVVLVLKNDPQVGGIGLWGRSMGVVTAILYAERDPTINGIVLDSPYSK
jgi:pimeloyl-ACP methyl ester carboxylesterase